MLTKAEPPRKRAGAKFRGVGEKDRVHSTCLSVAKVEKISKTVLEGIEFGNSLECNNSQVS